jgi:hypothetical protein
MLKIVEVHAASGVRGEYVVLQNQGLVTVSLRGWALCTEAYLNGSPEERADSMYVFRDDIPIGPYTRVVLFTGNGEDGWVPTVDGRQAFCAYWNRQERVWTYASQAYVLHLSASTRIVKPADSLLAATAVSP